MSTFSIRLKELQDQVPSQVKIVAVSKTKPVELLHEAYDAGQRIFGENKVQEIVAKYPQMPEDVEWHMIGHLQSNKVRQVVPMVSMIHAVDSEKLLRKIQSEAMRINRIIPCLLQVHIATEEHKFGFSPDELTEFLGVLREDELSHVRLAGLMGMASFTHDENQVRKEFASLNKLFTELQGGLMQAKPDFKELSMGMTGDYPIAIEEGSTLIRVGTLLFGAR